MKLTYKYDTFWGDWRSNQNIIGGMVLMLLSILIIRDVFPIAIFVAMTGIFSIVVGVKSALRRMKTSADRHQEIMDKGYRSIGTIVDAGGKISLKTHYTGHRDKNNNRETLKHWASNWWIEVEYYSEEHGIYKRFRCEHMNKNAKLYRMIGKTVEVFTYDGSVYVRVLK